MSVGERAEPTTREIARWVRTAVFTATVLIAAGAACDQPEAKGGKAALRVAIARRARAWMEAQHFYARVGVVDESLTISAICDQRALASIRDALERMALRPEMVFTSIQCLGSSRLVLDTRAD